MHFLLCHFFSFAAYGVKEDTSSGAVIGKKLLHIMIAVGF